MPLCPNCSFCQTVKNGRIHHSQQRFKCVKCDRQSGRFHSQGNHRFDSCRAKNADPTHPRFVRHLVGLGQSRGAAPTENETAQDRQFIEPPHSSNNLPVDTKTN